jgi:transcription initiation factor IIF auxiliary subunit
LRESGPAGDENGVRGKRDDPSRKKNRRDKNVGLGYTCPTVLALLTLSSWN